MEENNNNLGTPVVPTNNDVNTEVSNTTVSSPIPEFTPATNLVPEVKGLNVERKEEVVEAQPQESAPEVTAPVEPVVETSTPVEPEPVVETPAVPVAPEVTSQPVVQPPVPPVNNFSLTGEPLPTGNEPKKNNKGLIIGIVAVAVVLVVLALVLGNKEDGNKEDKTTTTTTTTTQKVDIDNEDNELEEDENPSIEEDEDQDTNEDEKFVDLASLDTSKNLESADFDMVEMKTISSDKTVKLSSASINITFNGSNVKIEYVEGDTKLSREFSGVNKVYFDNESIDYDCSDLANFFLVTDTYIYHFNYEFVYFEENLTELPVRTYFNSNYQSLYVAYYKSYTCGADYLHFGKNQEGNYIFLDTGVKYEKNKFYVKDVRINSDRTYRFGSQTGKAKVIVFDSEADKIYFIIDENNYAWEVNYNTGGLDKVKDVKVSKIIDGSNSVDFLFEDGTRMDEPEEYCDFEY